MLSNDQLIDNAAACSQSYSLREPAVRECLVLNICKPFRKRIADLETMLRFLLEHPDCQITIEMGGRREFPRTMAQLKQSIATHKKRDNA